MLTPKPNPNPALVQVQQSETDADDELLSLAVIKGGAKVVVGSQSGMLDVWSWGHWAGFSDRFPGELHYDNVPRQDEQQLAV